MNKRQEVIPFVWVEVGCDVVLKFCEFIEGEEQGTGFEEWEWIISE